MKLEDYKKEMIVCRVCGICNKDCPTANVKVLESYSPRGRLILSELLMRKRIKPTPKLVERIFTCTSCGRCDLACPSHVKSFEINEAARARLVKMGEKLPLAYCKVIENIEKVGNAFGESQRLRLEPLKGVLVNLPKKSENLFYAGCVASYKYARLANMATKILKKINFDFTVFGEEEVCCADPLLMLGMEEEFSRIAEENIKTFDKRGVKRIVTVCPMCYKAFKTDYPAALGKMDFEVLHITELLSRLIEEGKIKFTNKVPIKATYHDPCHLGRHSGVYEPPRKVLKAIPALEFIEIPEYNRENAWCCGGPIRIGFTDLAVAVSETIGERAKATGANALVTACPTCVHSLSFIAFDYNLKVYDVIELVTAALDLIDLK